MIITQNFGYFTCISYYSPCPLTYRIIFIILPGLLPTRLKWSLSAIVRFKIPNHNSVCSTFTNTWAFLKETFHHSSCFFCLFVFYLTKRYSLFTNVWILDVCSNMIIVYNHTGSNLFDSVNLLYINCMHLY